MSERYAVVMRRFPDDRFSADEDQKPWIYRDLLMEEAAGILLSEAGGPVAVVAVHAQGADANAPVPGLGATVYVHTFGDRPWDRISTVSWPSSDYAAHGEWHAAQTAVMGRVLACAGELAELADTVLRVRAYEDREARSGGREAAERFQELHPS
jgi:hypothetical protein